MLFKYKFFETVIGFDDKLSYHVDHFYISLSPSFFQAYFDVTIELVRDVVKACEEEMVRENKRLLGIKQKVVCFL